jgi:hypothetical protein
MRNDVLVYTSAPLAERVDVTGNIEVELYVSSDRRDTDFTIKLVDVGPDGRAFNLDDGMLRARWREGWEKPVFMETGKVYKLPIPPLVTSNSFAAGHRIRIEVSSSAFPHFDRNLNTGGNNYDEKDWLVARNVLHHAPNYLSKIVLPIVKSGVVRVRNRARDRRGSRIGPRSHRLSYTTFSYANSNERGVRGANDTVMVSVDVELATPATGRGTSSTWARRWSAGPRAPHRRLTLASGETRRCRFRYPHWRLGMASVVVEADQRVRVGGSSADVRLPRPFGSRAVNEERGTS